MSKQNENLLNSVEVKEILSSIRNKWDVLSLNGAFVFDLDETLLAPDISLSQEPEVAHLLSRLLRKGVRVALISGGPGAVVSRRVFEPMRDALGDDKYLLTRMAVYANGGSTKYLADESAAFLEDFDYSVRHRIDAKHLIQVKLLVEKYAAQYFNIPVELRKEVTSCWLQKRDRQWKALSVQFDDSWISGKPWRVNLWKDENMDQVKSGLSSGKTSFPFINIRGLHPGADQDFDGLAGFCLSGFYQLRKASGDSLDFDWRDTLMELLKKDLDKDSEVLAMKKAGRSSIDITRHGTDKASALKDFVMGFGVDCKNAFYFGDEFFEGGNDLPVAADKTLRESGMRFVAFNRHLSPAIPEIVWAGKSYHAARKLLSLVLDDE